MSSCFRAIRDLRLVGAQLHQCVDKARARVFEIVPRTDDDDDDGGRKLVAFSELSALRCGEIRATN